MNNTDAQRVTHKAMLYLFEQRRRRALDSQQRHIMDDPCFRDAQKLLSDSLQRLRDEQRAKCLFNLKARFEAKAHVVAVLGDMDRMLKLNDEFGHQSGDVVLLSVAQMFAKEFDGNFYQMGDGFWAFAAERRSSSVERDLDSLRAEIGNLHFEQHPRLKASISIGVAFSDQSKSTAEDLFQMAKNGLHQAKREGGNCIRIHSL
jgi:diguanylate cyclase (GGDEF)-like protein